MFGLYGLRFPWFKIEFIRFKFIIFDRNQLINSVSYKLIVCFKHSLLTKTYSKSIENIKKYKNHQYYVSLILRVFLSMIPFESIFCCIQKILVFSLSHEIGRMLTGLFITFHSLINDSALLKELHFIHIPGRMLLFQYLFNDHNILFVKILYAGRFML